MKGWWIGCIVMASCSVLQAKVLRLSEKQLVELARKQNPQSLEWQKTQVLAQIPVEQWEEIFQPALSVDASYSKTNKQPVVVFAPTFSPMSQISVGVRQQLPWGLSSGWTVFNEQTSTTDHQVVRSTLTGGRLNLAMDLWKNFMGKLDQLRREGLMAQKSIQDLRIYVDQVRFEQNIRKIYWALVFNQESRHLTEAILKSAKSQLKAAQQKLQESVTTEADVARHQAQVSTHQAMLTALEYQYQNYLLQLQQVLPSLKNHEISLASYKLDEVVKQVMQCSRVIRQHIHTPWDFTQYDEWVGRLERYLYTQEQVWSHYDRSDVKLFLEGELSGRGSGYKGSWEQLDEDPRFAYRAGVSLTFPLGSQKTALAYQQKLAEKLGFESEKQRLLALADARHERMLPMLKLLEDTVQARQKSSHDLEQALHHSRKMYDQARIPLETYIHDQNALLGNQIEEIKVKQIVVNEMLSYFEIFSQTPCLFNKIRG